MHHFYFLVGAISTEILATTSLKLSDGFTRPVPSVVTVLGYAVSFYLLSLALKRMEIGVVYAIWSGVGTAAMALVGYWLFAEGWGLLKLASIVCIIVGVVGLNLADGPQGTAVQDPVSPTQAARF